MCPVRGPDASQPIAMMRSRGSHQARGENTDGGGQRKSNGDANPQGLQRATPCCDKIQQGKTDACRSRIAV
jgi:hypothetical protein